jgi:hypothetical protein
MAKIFMNAVTKPVKPLQMRGSTLFSTLLAFFHNSFSFCVVHIFIRLDVTTGVQSTNG